MKLRIIYMILFAALTSHAIAQTSDDSASLKAWEFGLGGTVFHFNRMMLTGYDELPTGEHMFDIKFKQTIYGGNLYVARELTEDFYLDLQGSIAATPYMQNNQDISWLCMIGPGIQWRLGRFFNATYIDPYLRAGINYMYKSFEIMYSGVEGTSTEQINWFLKNLRNKSGADKKHVFPIALGGGINLWFNNNWGLGMQADYLILPHKNVADSLQGTVRLMYRFGGQDKALSTFKRIEKSIDISSPGVRSAYVFDDENFDFDKAVIRPESYPILDELALMIKNDPHNMFLITGYTDILGNSEYNMTLATDRAKAVTKGLIERGVPAHKLKYIGVGSKTAHAWSSDSDELRSNDRKITIEAIKSQEYWESRLPEHHLGDYK